MQTGKQEKKPQVPSEVLASAPAGRPVPAGRVVYVVFLVVAALVLWMLPVYGLLVPGPVATMEWRVLGWLYVAVWPAAAYGLIRLQLREGDEAGGTKRCLECGAKVRVASVQCPECGKVME